MLTLLDNAYFLVEFDRERDVIFLRRKELPVTDIPEFIATIDNVLKATAPYTKKPTLVDLRQVRGNNDPKFEQLVAPHVQRTLQMFALRCLLVQTRVGQLHAQRISREHNLGAPVFSDEQEAINYLQTNRR